MSHFNKHTIVVGSARSGTSWLSENMAKVFRYRMLFEPEHTERTSKGHLVADQWVTEDNQLDYKHSLKYLEKVFKNRVDSDWIAQNSNRKYKMHLWPLIPKHFIIKFVRGNLMAPYLNQNYNIPVVHVIRNPIDVIKSQKRSNFSWLYDFSYFLKQQYLVELIQKEFSYDLNQINDKSATEKLVVRWCIENVIPLNYNTNKKNNYFVIRYEDLRTDIKAYKDLCYILNIDIFKSIDKVYRKPSTKTHSKSNIKGNTDKREFLNIDDKNTICKVLETFNQSLYGFKKEK